MNSLTPSRIVNQLMHMNGRVYDPSLGRMLSPDPVTQAPENGKNYNRYTYAYNNPLKYADPSGYMSFELGENRGEFEDQRHWAFPDFQTRATPIRKDPPKVLWREANLDANLMGNGGPRPSAGDDANTITEVVGVDGQVLPSIFGISSFVDKVLTDLDNSAALSGPHGQRRDIGKVIRKDDKGNYVDTKGPSSSPNRHVPEGAEVVNGTYSVSAIDPADAAAIVIATRPHGRASRVSFRESDWIQLANIVNVPVIVRSTHSRARGIWVYLPGKTEVVQWK